MHFTAPLFFAGIAFAGKGDKAGWAHKPKPSPHLHDRAGTDSLVTLNLFATCGTSKQRVMFLEANKCETLDGAGGLRVTAHGDVKYNALRVYKGGECRGGWSLQPLEDACSSVKDFGSIMVVTYE